MSYWATYFSNLSVALVASGLLGISIAAFTGQVRNRRFASFWILSVAAGAALLAVMGASSIDAPA